MKEKTLQKKFDSTILSNFNKGHFGSFLGSKGKRISYVKFLKKKSVGALVIIHGAHETYIKYAELVHDLSKLNYSIYLMDLRGHGFSEKLLPSTEDKMYIDKFEYYIDDLKLFYNNIIKPDNHSSHILLSHSLGAQIATLYLQKHQNDFDKGILCSPMHKIDSGDIPYWIASLLVRAFVCLGQGKKYAVGEGPSKTEKYEDNELCHCAIRFNIWENKLKSLYPEIKVGGATNKWVYESFKATKIAKKNAHKLDIPILLLQAELDLLVDNQGQEEIIKRAKNIKKCLFHGAYHELFTEKDEIRDLVMKEIIEFIKIK